MAADLDWESMDPPGPQTERPKERGFHRDVDEDLGKSDELEGDEGDVGDIADEGTGRRG
jgi:hypothetical protein